MKKNNKQTTKKKNNNYKWIIEISLITFIIAFSFSFLSEITIPNVNIIVGLLLLLLFIVIGVIFDMIGVAVTSCSPTPFHAMSAKKIKGANMAVHLHKNVSKVSSFCNDVIGDICGIISGAVGASLSVIISTKYNINIFITSLLITALIASLTIGSKAFGKAIAIKNSNQITYKFAYLLSKFTKKYR